jgi:hypothetical protein
MSCIGFARGGLRVRMLMFDGREGSKKAFVGLYRMLIKTPVPYRDV